MDRDIRGNYQGKVRCVQSVRSSVHSIIPVTVVPAASDKTEVCAETKERATVISEQQGRNVNLLKESHRKEHKQEGRERETQRVCACVCVCVCVCV